MECSRSEQQTCSWVSLLEFRVMLEQKDLRSLLGLSCSAVKSNAAYRIDVGAQLASGLRSVRQV